MAPALLFDDLNLALASGAFSASLVVLFMVRGIHRTYPVFFCFCIFDLFMTALPFLPGRIETNRHIELGGWMLQWIFYFLLVLELIDRILTDHPGLAKLGRRVIQAVMIIAVITAVFSLKLDSVSTASITDGLRLFFQIERVVAGCLVMFLLLINLFLWYFPVRLNRNTKAYCWGFTLFFLVKAIAPILVNMAGMESIAVADRIHLGGIFLCDCIWLFAVTKRGVERTPAFARHWTAAEQEEVLASLQGLEHQISRTRGR